MVEEKLPDLIDICRHNAIRRLELFGSSVRNDFNPETSDLDLLAIFATGCEKAVLSDPGVVTRAGTNPARRGCAWVLDHYASLKPYSLTIDMDARDPSYREARRLSCYPDGGRHEAQSIPLINAAPAALESHDRDLVLHLVGSHHGCGRPFMPVIHDPDPQSVSISQRRHRLFGEQQTLPGTARFRSNRERTGLAQSRAFPISPCPQ